MYSSIKRFGNLKNMKLNTHDKNDNPTLAKLKTGINTPLIHLIKRFSIKFKILNSVNHKKHWVRNDTMVKKTDELCTWSSVNL